MLKRLTAFIDKRLNIKLNKNCNALYLASFISTLLCTYSNPCIVKEIVSCLPAQYLSVESLTICLSNLLIGMIWKGKTRDSVIRNFTIFAVLETVASILLGIWLLFISYNVWVMAIASVIYVNFISLFICKCVMTFKSKLFIEKDREDFDNSSSTIISIASIVGFVCATMLMPSLPTAILFWSLACVFDDVGWIIIYLQNKAKLTED